MYSIQSTHHGGTYLRIINNAKETSINNKRCNYKDKPVINKIKPRQGYVPLKVV
jgi:hypothetical protein